MPCGHMGSIHMVMIHTCRRPKTEDTFLMARESLCKVRLVRKKSTQVWVEAGLAMMCTWCFC